MRIESSYPAPIHGVSTLSPRNRMEGQAGLQVNFRSDPVSKLTRRPSSTWVAKLATASGKLFIHTYQRDGATFRLITEIASGKVYCFKNTQLVSTLTIPNNYVGSNMVAQSVGHSTYLVNKDKEVTLSNDTDVNDVMYVSYINVISALNYGETVQVRVVDKNSVVTEVSYKVPDLYSNSSNNINYDEADQARATNQVAQELKTLLVNANASFTATSTGSAVAIYAKGVNNDTVDVSIATGQGDKSCKVINTTIESTEGLPLYAIHDSHVTVKPNPTTDKGTYYLRAKRTSERVNLVDLEEVVWVESRNHTQKHSIDSTTTPVKIDYDGSTFSIANVSLKSRQTGDDSSVKVPAFVGKTIVDVGYFQKRLVFLSDDNVVMSETDDLPNFWKQSAVQLIVTDPVTIASSATGIDTLQHIVSHNRDLMIVASNAQFKIVGTEAVTPQTISMALTASYVCQTEVKPVTSGVSVLLPTYYGDSTGLSEYRGENLKAQDKASSVTTHVRGYMKGKVRLLAVSQNDGVVALATEGETNNTLFIYSQYEVNGKREQQAWCTWKFSQETNIVHIEFKDSVLLITSQEGSSVILKEVKLNAPTATTENEIFLDDMVKLSTTGNSVTLPTSYNTTGMVVIQGDGLDFQYTKVKYSVSNNTVTFNENLGSGSVYIGKVYESRYIPTRPFKRDDKGIAVTTDRLRIGSYILYLVDTNKVAMHINSKYYSSEDQVFNSRRLDETTSILGAMAFHTGELRLSYAQDARYSDVEFYCDNWLGCTIAGISWAGQYFQTARRM